MSKNRIASCSFPSTKLFLDDSESFLKNLVLDLDERLLYKIFSDPRKAIQFLTNEYQSITSPNRWLSNLKARDDLGDLEKDEFTHTFLEMNLFSIHQLAYDPHRFDEISVVVVDFAMPPMNGAEFCRQISHLPVKKILLTGQADYTVAINAFNDGLIDRFVVKGEHAYTEQLKEYLDELEYQYFLDRSELIIKNLANHSSQSLNDPAFIEFFDRIRKEKNIIEYYLINRSGSYLLLDERGKSYWLIITNVSELDEYADVAEGNDAPDSIVQSLRQHEKILFLFSQKDQTDIPVQQWDKYMYPALTIDGQRGDYFCALIEGPDKYELYLDRILTFGSYLDSL